MPKKKETTAAAAAPAKQSTSKATKNKRSTREQQCFEAERESLRQSEVTIVEAKLLEAVAAAKCIQRQPVKVIRPKAKRKVGVQEGCKASAGWHQGREAVDERPTRILSVEVQAPEETTEEGMPTSDYSATAKSNNNNKDKSVKDPADVGTRVNVPYSKPQVVRDCDDPDREIEVVQLSDDDSEKKSEDTSIEKKQSSWTEEDELDMSMLVNDTSMVFQSDGRSSLKNDTATTPISNNNIVNGVRLRAAQDVPVVEDDRSRRSSSEICVIEEIQGITYTIEKKLLLLPGAGVEEQMTELIVVDKEDSPDKEIKDSESLTADQAEGAGSILRNVLISRPQPILIKEESEPREEECAPSSKSCNNSEIQNEIIPPTESDSNTETSSETEAMSSRFTGKQPHPPAAVVAMDTGYNTKDGVPGVTTEKLKNESSTTSKKFAKSDLSFRKPLKMFKKKKKKRMLMSSTTDLPRSSSSAAAAGNKSASKVLFSSTKKTLAMVKDSKKGTAKRKSTTSGKDQQKRAAAAVRKRSSSNSSEDAEMPDLKDDAYEDNNVSSKSPPSAPRASVMRGAKTTAKSLIKIKNDYEEDENYDDEDGLSMDSDSGTTRLSSKYSSKSTYSGYNGEASPPRPGSALKRKKGRPPKRSLEAESFEPRMPSLESTSPPPPKGKPKMYNNTSPRDHNKSKPTMNGEGENEKFPTYVNKKWVYNADHKNMLYGDKRFVAERRDLIGADRIHLWRIMSRSKLLQKFRPVDIDGREFHCGLDIYKSYADLDNDDFYVKYQPVVVDMLVETERYQIGMYYKLSKSLPVLGYFRLTDHLFEHFKKYLRNMTIRAMTDSEYLESGTNSIMTAPDRGDVDPIEANITEFLREIMMRKQWPQSTMMCLLEYPNLSLTRAGVDRNANCESCAKLGKTGVGAYKIFFYGNCYDADTLRLTNEVGPSMPDYQFCYSCPLTLKAVHRLVHYKYWIFMAIRMQLQQLYTLLKPGQFYKAHQVFDYIMSDFQWVRTMFYEFQTVCGEGIQAKERTDRQEGKIKKELEKRDRNNGRKLGKVLKLPKSKKKLGRPRPSKSPLQLPGVSGLGK